MYIHKNPLYVGQTGGLTEIQLHHTQLPTHSHRILASSELADENSPIGNTWATTEINVNVYNPFNGDQPMTQ